MSDIVPVAGVAAREARWTRGRARQRIAVLVSAAVIATTVTALATNGALGSTGSGLDAPIAAGTDVTAPTIAPGSSPADAGLDPPGTISFFQDPSSGSAGGPVEAPASTDVPGDLTPPTVETVGPDGETVIVHPVLQFLAFGGQIGMPLVCTLVASTFGQFVTDPAVTAVVGQIQSTCVLGANEGADALRDLDAQLASLAALNPAVQPVLDGLAASLEAAAQTEAPFASYLLQIVALVRFFQGR